MKRHAHGHGHVHDANRVEERQVGATVTATINGVVEHWLNSYTGQSSTAAPAPAASSSSAAAAGGSPSSSEGSGSGSSSESSSSPSSSSGSSSGGTISSSSGGWGRQAYYDSSAGQSEGLVFLNHYGGQGSGTFDNTFGNSLSYASSDGASGSSSPQTLKDTTLASDVEVVVMSNNQCQGSDCGYSRPNTVAYHGFDGAQKAFFFEFGMPSDGQTSGGQYSAVNMPAIWMLNAQIPRTLQYGQADCSCWTSGCGEFDIFEVLAPNDSRCKSTLHGNIAGGDSDYFDRPFSGTIKAALVLYNDNIHIKVLDNNTDFGSTMSTDTLNNICGSTLTQNNAVSLFNLVGAASG